MTGPARVPSLGIVLTLVSVGLSACFFGGRDQSCRKQGEYQRSASAAQIKIPEGLDTPRPSDRLVIPEVTLDEDAVPPDNPCLEQPPDFFGRPLD
jgi:uncharacterized lipoprotein